MIDGVGNFDVSAYVPEEEGVEEATNEEEIAAAEAIDEDEELEFDQGQVFVD